MKIQLLEHQNKAVAIARTREFFAFFMEMGTGKTFCAMQLIEEWCAAGRERIIVVCPNALRGNWMLESEKFGLSVPIATLDGSALKRKKIIASPDWQVLVVNYEATRNLVEDLISAKPDGLILDEMQRVKDRSSHQTKSCRSIASAVKHARGVRIGMTGTPIVKDPLDLWSEFDVLNPSEKAAEDHPLGYGKYVNFERAVCTIYQSPYNRFVRKFTFPPDRLAELRRRVAAHVFEATKDECLDLPERTFTRLLVEPHPEQARIYKTLKEDFCALLEADKADSEASRPASGIESVMDELEFLHDGPIEQAEGERVTTLMAATTLIRLHQIASGFVRTDDKELKDLPNPKLDLLEDLIPQWTATEGDHKVVIFCRFVHDVKVLTKLCEKLNIGYVSLSGENSGDSRAVCEAFQNSRETRVFIGNVAVAGVGLTLTAADYVCFYNNSFKLEDRLQALDRAHRIGQKRKVSYYDLVLKGTVDEKVLNGLDDKRDLAHATTRNLSKLSAMMELM